MNTYLYSNLEVFKIFNSQLSILHLLLKVSIVLISVYSALIALLFSAFLIYDTQQIIGGKKYEISPEEHVYASIQLYIDVVYIFLAILNLGRR